MMTKKEQTIYFWIVKFIAKYKYYPKQIEISKMSNTDPGLLNRVLVQLRRKGYVTWESKKQRTLRLTDFGEAEFSGLYGTLENDS